MNKFDSFITFLQTEDLEETTKFYTEIMKCKLVVDQGLCRIFAISNDAYVGFCSHDFLDKDKNSICLTFVCSSQREVDEWYKIFQAKNVKCLSEPHDVEELNIRCFIAEDPEGYIIEIQHFLGN